MTTIVYNNGQLIADSCLTDYSAGIKQCNVSKIFRVLDGWLAGAGSYSQLFSLSLLMKESPFNEIILDDKFDEHLNAIFMNDKGIGYSLIMNKGERIVGIKLSPDEPYAVGSGCEYFTGAVSASQDIRKSLNITAKYDMYTSSPFAVVFPGNEGPEELV